MSGSVFCNILCFFYVRDVVHRLLRTVIGVKYPDPKIEAYNVLMYQSLDQSLAQYIIQVVHNHIHMII
jgi:hypothetical protein